jgi:hypothetical protein
MTVFDRAMSLCAEAKPGDVVGSITLVRHLCGEPDFPEHDPGTCVWLIQCSCGRLLGRSPEKVPSEIELNEQLARLSRNADTIGDKSKNLTDDEAKILKDQFDAEALAGRKPQRFP